MLNEAACVILFDGVFNGIGSGCQDEGACEPCTGDTNFDGEVDVIDLVTVITAWGECD